MNEYKHLMQIYLRKLPDSEREKLTADGKKLAKPSIPTNAQVGGRGGGGGGGGDLEMLPKHREFCLLKL